jgi:hypothetical protein
MKFEAPPPQILSNHMERSEDDGRMKIFLKPVNNSGLERGEVKSTLRDMQCQSKRRAIG